MVVVERLLSCSLGHRGGELTTRHLVAEDDVADGIGSLRTAKPHVHDGRQMLLFPSKDGGTTREVEQYDRLSRPGELSEQMALGVGHTKVGTAGTFATHIGSLAHGANDDVSLACNLKGFCLHLRIVASGDGLAQLTVLLLLFVVHHVAALCIEQRRLALEGFLHALTQRGIAIGGGSHAPGSAHVAACVGQGTDEGYLALLAEGQQLTVVLEQDEGLGGNVACGLAMGSGKDVGLMSLAVAVTVRILEESQLVFSL